MDVFPSFFRTEIGKKFVYIKPFQFQRKGIKYIWLFYDLEGSDKYFVVFSCNICLNYILRRAEIRILYNYFFCFFFFFLPNIISEQFLNIW